MAGIILDEAAKAARNEYHREWRKNNRDKVARHQAAYWAKKAKEASESVGVKNQGN